MFSLAYSATTHAWQLVLVESLIGLAAFAVGALLGVLFGAGLIQIGSIGRQLWRAETMIASALAASTQVPEVNVLTQGVLVFCSAIGFLAGFLRTRTRYLRGQGQPRPSPPNRSRRRIVYVL